eukprot:757501-Hanusia_phi.AAC.2
MSIQVQDFCFMSMDASFDAKQEEPEEMNYGIFFLGSDSRRDCDGHSPKNEISPARHSECSGKTNQASDPHVTISLCDDISRMHLSSGAVHEFFLKFNAEYSNHRPFRMQSDGLKGMLLGNVRSAVNKTLGSRANSVRAKILI